ncbi:4-hydroxythreonine-4-phosphate dehydrogenase PdxA [Bdellovibrio reynosensis]|uniref:4-hydroxythreonine-4-phosphate dehydrogenase PdxA n=1 Tax=Bdellovibrio reynosensis TaxID=2835041 RepID=A0ABY4CDV4_9BACT|nr:4-hydroxythreonine-4-phosphate dehydrogenase PdxA [Bdellovibrio reynosensis]UOF00385.1 4-hydroxythreonine-4-phosphate dehydrogenase PdxA [Bdellovibrio reynosensis]
MSKIRIALTTGDADGIGFEVTAKALSLLPKQKGVQFIMWRTDGADKKYLSLIDKKYERITVDTLEEALKIEGPYLIDIASELSPAHWVEVTAKACLDKKIDAMATAPLSKPAIKQAGFKDLGHTDILKRLSKSKFVNMGFIGEKFNVVLATAHLPINKVSESLRFDNLSQALINANSLRTKLTKLQSKRPIAILGLNPHAGERGLIGNEELKLFPQILDFAKKNKIPIEGPLVPDAAFFETNWKRYSVYLALYHDQGLIPFKMIHGQDSGVHISLGIPFIRTSVDHGTAKDIFGKNVANPHSMMDAITWAVKLARLKRA